MIAMAMHGLDDVLTVGVVIDGFPGLHDGPGKGRFGDDLAGPDGILQFVLVDGPVCILRQVGEKIEHARLHGQRLAIAQQLP